jgi:hypothetical protein
MQNSAIFQHSTQGIRNEDAFCASHAARGRSKGPGARRQEGLFSTGGV